LYVVPAAPLVPVAPGAAPGAPAGDDPLAIVPVVAFFSSNPPLAPADGLAAPGAALGLVLAPADAAARQPVTVIVCAESLDCAGRDAGSPLAGGCCAATPVAITALINVPKMI